jgi:hypothetical protein
MRGFSTGSMGWPHYLDRIGAILREGLAVLRGFITGVSGLRRTQVSYNSPFSLI